jgi:hypothetical protein
MKNYIKINNLIALLVLLFFIPLYSYGQEIIELEGDTMVTISQGQLKTINSIIVDKEYTSKENILLDSLVLQKDSVISILTKKYEIKDSIVSRYLRVIDFQEDRIDGLEKSIKKEKIRKVGWGIGGGIVGIILGILVAK